MFEYINKTFEDNEIVCIMNADIFLDHCSSWNTLFNVNGEYVYALSRHEFDGKQSVRDSMLNRVFYCNCQDAWIFKTPINIPDDCNFTIGTMGCDNAISHRLKQKNYTLINDSDRYMIHHYDICRKKTQQNYKEKSKEYEKKANIKNDKPETRGTYLCPIMKNELSVDEMIRNLNINNYKKHEIICDIYSKILKIRNEV